MLRSHRGKRWLCQLCWQNRSNWQRAFPPQGTRLKRDAVWCLCSALTVGETLYEGPQGQTRFTNIMITWAAMGTLWRAGCSLKEGSVVQYVATRVQMLMWARH